MPDIIGSNKRRYISVPDRMGYFGTNTYVSLFSPGEGGHPRQSKFVRILVPSVQAEG